MPFAVFLVLATAVSTATVASAVLIRDRTYAIIAAFTGGAAVFFLNAGVHARWYHDDSFITLRYARNLADGLGPVYNAGERVEGYTNFLWMLLLAGMSAAGFDLVSASLVLSYAASLACLIAIWRLWALWAADDPARAIAHPAVLAITLLLVGLSGSVAGWAFAGLETPLTMALLASSAYLFLREQRSGGFPASAFVFTAGAMNRPEVVAVIVVTAAYGIISALRTGDWAALRRMALWCGIVAALYAPYFAWRWWYYGYPLPNTFYVKVGSNLDAVTRGVSYLTGVGNAYALLPLTIGAVALCAHPHAGIRRDATYLLVVIAAWLTVVVLEGGDLFPYGRFVAPVVPLLTLAGVAGACLALQSFTKDSRRFATVGLAAAMLIALALAQSSADPARRGYREATTADRRAGLLLEERVPDSYTIGVIAAGAIPYYSRLNALDMLGLMDETIAHTDVPSLGTGLAGHEKYNIDYVLQRRPEVIITSSFATQPYTRAEIEARTRVGGFQIAAFTLLVRDPRLWEDYQMSALRAGNEWYSFLQRRDTLDDFVPDWTEGGP